MVVVVVVVVVVVDWLNPMINHVFDHHNLRPFFSPASPGTYSSSALQSSVFLALFIHSYFVLEKPTGLPIVVSSRMLNGNIFAKTHLLRLCTANTSNSVSLCCSFTFFFLLHLFIWVEKKEIFGFTFANLWVSIVFLGGT